MKGEERLQCALGLSGETLSAWRDRLLPEADAQHIALHVTDCAACQRWLTQFTQVAAAIQRQREPDLRAQTWRGLQSRLIQREQQSRRFPRTAAFSSIGAIALLALIAVLVVLVFHQRPGGRTVPASVASATATATSTIPATSTTVSAASCASALPGAGPASAGPSFTDLPLPASSVSLTPTKTGGGGAGQFTLFDLQMCTSSSSAAAINTFFTGLTAHSWLHSNTFPVDGAYQSNCPDSYCWAKDVRYVSLQEPITDLGGGVESYHLMLATAPPAPNCNGTGSTFSTGYYYKLPDPNYQATNAYNNIPLPPLSRIVPVYASGGQRGYGICSAGTVASITAFMDSHLTGLGWTAGSNGTWTKSGFSLTVLVSSATDWHISWHDPDFH
jgi:hypothetical protein